MDIKPNIVIKDKYWLYLTYFWSFVAFTAIIFDFIYNNSFGSFLAPILVIYIAILTIYVGVKEFERWQEFHKGRHPGEIFVFMWTLMIFGIIIAQFILKTPYKIPQEVISTYIAVLGILAITSKSKSLHRTSHRPQD